MSTITKFKANFDGGARPNLFKCLIDFPTGGNTNKEKATFLVKGASLPGGIIAPIEVPYRGRKLKVAGDRTFEPWTITVINDTDMALRNAFEDWMNKINRHSANTTSMSGNEYMLDMSIQQLGRGAGTGPTAVGSDGVEKVLKEYLFVGAWPSNISPIDLNFETNDTIEEFTVEINYQYWTTADSSAD